MNSCIWILLLLFCCNGNNSCGCGNSCVSDNCGCQGRRSEDCGDGRGRERNDRRERDCDEGRGRDRNDRRERDCDEGRGRDRNDGCGCEQPTRPILPPPPRPPRPPFEDCGCN